MSRRAKRGRNNKSNLNLVPIAIGIGIALVAVAAIVVVPKLLVKEKAATLNTKAYSAQSKDFVGNTYSFVGSIVSIEQRGNKSLLFVKDEKPDGDTVHVWVANALRDENTDINLNIKNSYLFTVKVDDQNYIMATAIESK